MEIKEGKNKELLNSSSGLSLDDQQWIQENIIEDGIRNNDISVNGSVSGSYKNEITDWLNTGKSDVVTQLLLLNYRTSPRDIDKLLQNLFSFCNSKVGHWLYVAQHWTPRAIGRVLKQMFKQHQRGEKTIQNPAAYFTNAIKYRKRRKGFRSSIGARKQQHL